MRCRQDCKHWKREVQLYLWNYDVVLFLRVISTGILARASVR